MSLPGRAAARKTDGSRQRWRAPAWLGALIVFLLLITGWPVRAMAVPAPTQIPLPPPPSAVNQYEAVFPSLQSDVAATAGPLTTYTITARLDPARHEIVADEQVTFINRFDLTLSDLSFRLFPNADYYHPGGLAITKLSLDGKAIERPELSVQDTVLRLPLPRPLMPLETATVELGFTTTVPVNSTGSFGIFTDDLRQGTWILADWYPIIAGHDATRGWRLDPPTPAGDPTFADEALYDVTLTAPANLVIAASGSEIARVRAGNEVLHRFADGPGRDFTFVADDNYVAVQAKAGGTTVTGYANPGNVAGMKFAVGVAASALETYSRYLGLYPFQSLNLVDVPLVGASGVSWTGMVFLNDASLRGDPGKDANAAEGLRFTVAHEIGHQWWGMSVGANSNDHPFMVEGLTNYTDVLYFEWIAGRAASTDVLTRFVAAPYQALLPSNDGVADEPVADGQNASQRAALIYGKAALGFLAIREAIGDRAFFQGLHDYATAYAYRIATPDDLLHAFEQAAGRDLTSLWHHWFNAAQTTPAEVQALLAKN